MRYLLIVSLFLPILVSGQRRDFPEKPTNYVTDHAEVLTKSEEQSLNAKLRAFEDSTSNQLFIYVAKGLNGKNLEDYSREIFNTWQIGQAGKDNGILIAIFINNREYRIQTGYGMEKTLPTDLLRHIQDEEMRQHFRDYNYYKGIDAGVDQLIYYTRNEYEPPGPLDFLIVPAMVSYGISIVLFVINLLSVRKWKYQPKRRQKNILAFTIFLLIPFVGTVVLGGLCLVINDKSESQYDYESDEAHERRMQAMRSSQSSSDDSSSNDSFDGGGGGSSGSGGSSSNW